MNDSKRQCWIELHDRTRREVAQVKWTEEREKSGVVVEREEEEEEEREEGTTRGRGGCVKSTDMRDC